MADIKISCLPAATSINPNNDVLPVVTGGGATTSKATPYQLLAYSPAAPLVAGSVYGRSVSCTTAQVAYGYGAGRTQGCQTVAVGYCAGATQGARSVAIGARAGYHQGFNSIAIGYSAQGVTVNNAISIGYSAGSCGQANSTIIIGSCTAANVPNSVVIGNNVIANTCGFFIAPIRSKCTAGGNPAKLFYCTATQEILSGCDPLATPTSVGVVYGQTPIYCTTTGTSYGHNAGLACQHHTSLAIGKNSATASQGAYSVVVGSCAAPHQGQNSVAIGYAAQACSIANCAIAIGSTSGGCSQADSTIVIGKNANATASNAIVIGNSLIATNSGVYISEMRCKCAAGVTPVALGYCATTKELVYGNTASGGATPTSLGSVYGQTTACAGGLKTALGFNAGLTNQANSSVAIGANTGLTNQKTVSVAIGYYAGETCQGAAAVAIGVDAGKNNQGCASIAIGACAGASNQGSCSIAIGICAGATNQGASAIAIGRIAGGSSQAANSIAIGSASNVSVAGGIAIGSCLAASAAGLFIHPIRSKCVAGGSPVGLNYCVTSKELVYGTLCAVFNISALPNATTINPSSDLLPIVTCYGTVTSKATPYQIFAQSPATPLQPGAIYGKTTACGGAIAYGYYAGETGQSASSIAIGNLAGSSNQACFSVAIGCTAGYRQGQNSVAVGYRAQYATSANCTISIGALAGGCTLADRTITIGKSSNATVANGIALGNCVTASQAGFFVDPVRQCATAPANGFVAVYYNPTTKEFAHL